MPSLVCNIRTAMLEDIERALEGRRKRNYGASFAFWFAKYLGVCANKMFMVLVREATNKHVGLTLYLEVLLVFAKWNTREKIFSKSENWILMKNILENIQPMKSDCNKY